MAQEGGDDTFVALHKTKGIEQILEGLTHYSQRIDNKIEDIKLSISEINNFYYIEKYEESENKEIKIHAEHPIIYQYAHENLTEFNEHKSEIQTEVEATYTLMLDIIERLSTLNILKDIQQPQQNGNTGTQIFTGNNKQQAKKQFNLPDFFMGERKKVSELNPVDQSSDIIKELKQLPAIIANWTIWHTKAIERAEMISGLWEGQMYLLKNERMYFEEYVAPRLQSVIAAGNNVRVSIEAKRNALIMSKAIEGYEREAANPYSQMQSK